MRKESKIGKNVIEKKLTIEDVRLVNINALQKMEFELGLFLVAFNWINMIYLIMIFYNSTVIELSFTE